MAGAAGHIDLPSGARIVLIYRDEDFLVADAETNILREDEVVVLTHSKNLPKLRERWETKG